MDLHKEKVSKKFVSNSNNLDKPTLKIKDVRNLVRNHHPTIERGTDNHRLMAFDGPSK
jgi:hypothetical protein